MHAVQFDHFGGTDVLEVREVPLRDLGPGDVAIEVRATGINPGESKIRSGALEQMFPTSFPSGEGSDLAGIVTQVGSAVTSWRVGQEVLGWTDERASHAEQVVAPADQLLPKPQSVPWQVAGSLFVTGTTAWAATRAVKPRAGETVLVSAATGGVGTLVVQLLAESGIHVIAVASDRNRDWLESKGATVVPYGSDLADRVRAAAPDGVDALIDLYGPEYLDLATELGIEPQRINTVVAFQEAARIGALTEGSSSVGLDALREIVERVADGRLEVPIAATYPLSEVRAAYDEVDGGHTFGKIVLLP